MGTEPKRVVVIQDASSREVNSEAIQKATKMLPLKAGDQLTIVPILDWFSSPSMFSCFGRKRLGYMMRVDSDYFVSPNKKIIEKQLNKRKEDYCTNQEMLKLSEHFRNNEIAFKIEVHVGAAAEVVSNVAREFQATSLIFDRQMYKEMKPYMDKFPCRLFKIKGNNSIENVMKRMKPMDNITKPLSQRHIEMNQGSAEEQLSVPRSKSSSNDIFSTTGESSSNWCTEASTSSLGGSQQGVQNFQDGKLYSNLEQTSENQSLFHTSLNQEISQIDANQKGKPNDCQEQHNNNNNEASDMEKEFTNPLCSVCNNRRPKFGSKRDFSYSELYTATKGFSQKNFLSEGGFGEVYKGQLDGMMIAVKQHKSASFQGEKEFKSEVNVLSKARHENVVMLLGSCSEKNSRLLVYEYVCNGSLDQHLSEHSRSPLSWKERIKVAVGAANGLLYLHNNSIIHRDMRPNNILITHDHHPLLGDFGLAKTQNHDSIHSTEVVGTLGYLAPEYAECGKVSTKSDVYSFGVVLLQLITGMRTTDKRLGGRTLVGWARPLLRDRNYSDLVDERINDSLDIHQLFWMVRLAEKCLSREPQKRLSMVAVVNALNGIVEGSTCDIKMKEYSPTRSDSSYMESEFDESYEEEGMQGYESEGESQSHHGTEFAATSSTTGHQMMHMFVRQPPSPPIPPTNSSNTSSIWFYDQSNIHCEAQDNDGNVEILNSEEGLLDA